MVVPADPETGPDWTEESTEYGGALRAVGVAVGLTVAAFVVSLLGGVAFVAPIVLLDLDVQSVPAFLALSVAGQLGFLVVGYAYASRRGLVIRIARPTRRDLSYALGGLVGSLVTAAVLASVLATLGLLPESVITDVVTANPNVLLGLAALSIVLVAPVEEFLFRGVIQGRLRQSIGPAGSIAMASLLFGSLHLTNYTGALDAVVAGALLIAATGSIFGVLYERTRNLVVPVLAHAAYNVVLMSITYLSL